MPPLTAQMRALDILPGSLAIWGLGQMGLAVRGPDALIVIDACLSDVVRENAGDWWTRAYAPPLLPAGLTGVDCFFVTHEHLDHLDPLTLGPAAKASPGARFVAPGWCRQLLNELDIADERIVVPPALEPLELGGHARDRRAGRALRARIRRVAGLSLAGLPHRMEWRHAVPRRRHRHSSRLRRIVAVPAHAGRGHGAGQRARLVSRDGGGRGRQPAAGRGGAPGARSGLGTRSFRVTTTSTPTTPSRRGKSSRRWRPFTRGKR